VRGHLLDVVQGVGAPVGETIQGASAAAWCILQGEERRLKNIQFGCVRRRPAAVNSMGWTRPWRGCVAQGPCCVLDRPVADRHAGNMLCCQNTRAARMHVGRGYRCTAHISTAVQQPGFAGVLPSSLVLFRCIQVALLSWWWFCTHAGRWFTWPGCAQVVRLARIYLCLYPSMSVWLRKVTKRCMHLWPKPSYQQQQQQQQGLGLPGALLYSCGASKQCASLGGLMVVNVSLLLCGNVCSGSVEVQPGQICSLDKRVGHVYTTHGVLRRPCSTRSRRSCGMYIPRARTQGVIGRPCRCRQWRVQGGLLPVMEPSRGFICRRASG
jgi:hypothetical protein